MSKSTFVYVTYIRTSPDRVWSALTTTDFIRQFWFGMDCQSDFKPGSPWKLSFADGRVADTGEIVEADAPRRLVIRWRNEFREELTAEGHSLCTFELESVADVDPAATKLTITHAIEHPESKFIHAVSGGWPKVLSNLKSLLEGGQIALQSRATAV
jgi:uncharacterized protein YndB with AHSA1/START domain